MKAKERRGAVREAYALARDWLYFARSMAEYAATKPESERSVYLLAVLEDLVLANKYRAKARSLRG